MQLLYVDAKFIDMAWRDGACKLSEACDESGGEITGDQLKMILARGERTLVQMRVDDAVVGWGVFRIDQLPNLRVLFITDLYAPGGHFEQFFAAIKDVALSAGCSRVRCAAKPVQARLYAIKCQFQPVYSILEVTL